MIDFIKLITLLSHLIILYFVYNLKSMSCECSEDSNREYIFYDSIIYIFITSVMLLVPQFFSNNKTLTTIIKLILVFGIILNVYCLYKYSQKLKGCKCSSENLRKFMEYYSYFYIGLLIITHLYIYEFYISNKHLRTL